MGRLYPLTAFLHPQGSDSARGLLRFAEPKPLGDHGLFWLRVHTANCWGEDKMRLEERARFVEDREWDYAEIAKDPLNNDLWMSAEKPWSFLACCFEFLAIREHQGSVKNYQSGLPIYLDGTCNGIQHLCALSKDEKIAPLVNLIESDKPGDVYSFIGAACWEELEKLYENTPGKFKGKLDEVIAKEKEFKDKLAEVRGKKELSNLVFQDLQKWRNHNRALREAVFPEFWLRVTDAKTRRKVVKRPVMCTGL